MRFVRINDSAAFDYLDNLQNTEPAVYAAFNNTATTQSPSGSVKYVSQCNFTASIHNKSAINMKSAALPSQETPFANIDILIQSIKKAQENKKV